MKRRALLLLLTSSACRNNDAEEPPLTRALLAAAQGSGRASAADVDKALAELSHLSEMARVAVAARGHLSEVGALAEAGEQAGGQNLLLGGRELGRLGERTFQEFRHRSFPLREHCIAMETGV